MKKLLLGSLVIMAIFTSCKKQDDFAASASGENQKTVLGSGEPQPTAVTAPTVFFLKKNGTNSANLFKIDNLTAVVPTITEIEQFANHNLIGQYLKPQYEWIYNTNTNQILTTDNTEAPDQFDVNMFRLSTSPIVGIIKTKLPVSEFNPAHLMILNPANTRIFYSILGQGSGVWSCKPDGTDAKFIAPPQTQFHSIFAMAIDFNDGIGKIYTAETKLDASQLSSVFVMDLDGNNKKLVKSLPLGETLTFNFDNNTWRPTLKVDQGKVFLSTKSGTNQADNKFHLFSISTSGVGVWKTLFEGLGNKLNSSFFSFDILPGKKIFYTSFQDGINIDINVIGRMNLDGTENKTLLITSSVIPRLVIALPKQ